MDEWDFIYGIFCHDDWTNWNWKGTAWHNCFKTSSSEKTDKEIIRNKSNNRTQLNLLEPFRETCRLQSAAEWLPLTRHPPSGAPNFISAKLRWLLLCFCWRTFHGNRRRSRYKCSSPVYWKSGRTYLSFGCNISRWSQMHCRTVVAWIMSRKNSAGTLSGKKKWTWQTF